jgi:hypothetical protein
MATHVMQPGPRERDTIPEIGPLPILVRDVVRRRLHEILPSERMLRVPYDLFNPMGSVIVRDGMITYLQGVELRTGRTAEAALDDSHPGERVLLRLQDGVSDSDEWWLCEIQYPAHTS